MGCSTSVSTPIPRFTARPCPGDAGLLTRTAGAATPARLRRCAWRARGLRRFDLTTRKRTKSPRGVPTNTMMAEMRLGAMAASIPSPYRLRKTMTTLPNASSSPSCNSAGAVMRVEKLA